MILAKCKALIAVFSRRKYVSKDEIQEMINSLEHN